MKNKINIEQKIDFNSSPTDFVVVDNIVLAGHSNGDLSISNLMKKQKPKTIPIHQESITSLSLSENQQFLVSTGGNKMNFFNVKNLYNPVKLQSKTYSCQQKCSTFSKDSSLLAIAGDDKTIRFFQTKNFKFLSSFSKQKDWIQCLDISQDNKQILSGGQDKKVFLSNINGNQVAVQSLRGSVNSVQFFSNDKFYITGDNKGDICIFDTRFNEIVQRYRNKGQQIRSIEFQNNDYQFLTGNDSGLVKLWDIRKGINIGNVQVHKGEVKQLRMVKKKLLSIGDLNLQVIQNPFLYNITQQEQQIKSCSISKTSAQIQKKQSKVCNKIQQIKMKNDIVPQQVSEEQIYKEEDINNKLTCILDQLRIISCTMNSIDKRIEKNTKDIQFITKKIKDNQFIQLIPIKFMKGIVFYY